MPAALRAPAFALAALSALSTAAVAQRPALTASVSVDSVGMADVFDLLVTIPVPEGSMVYFPDTIAPTRDVESSAPVSWRAERTDQGARLVLSYPLIAFGSGVTAVPGPEVVLVPNTDAVNGERIPGDSRVGDWEEAPRTTRYTLTAPPQRVWVRPVYDEEDVTAGLTPRPPADVLGLGWSWVSVLFILLFASVIGSTVVTATREWMESRPPAPAPPPPAPPTLEEARLRALSELDALLAEAPYGTEGIARIYERGSGVVRRYAERLHPEWGPELTSTELMGRLEAVEGEGLGGPALQAGLADSMSVAERVKFGRLRPDTASATGDLLALKASLSGPGSKAP